MKKIFFYLFLFIIAMPLSAGDKYKIVKEINWGNKSTVIIQTSNNRFYLGNGYGSYNYARNLAIERALRKFKFNKSDSISYKKFINSLK